MISAFDRKLSHENMRLVYKLGISPLENYLSRFKLGFEDESDIFSGKIRISLLDLAVAYNSFNNNGTITSPSIVDRVVDNGGKQVYVRQRSDARAIDPKASYLIKNLIQSKSKDAAYCAESDEGYDFICIDIHNKLSSISWFGSIDRKHKVSDEKKELLRSISFKKNPTIDFGNVSYFLLEEGKDKKFVPHYL